MPVAASRRLRARRAGGLLLRTLGELDGAGVRALRQHAAPGPFTRGVRAYSHLGEHGGLWIAVGIAGTVVDRRRREQWLTALAGVGAAYVANTSLKQLVRRPRPAFADLPPLIPTPGPLSFPSSHSASSAAAIVGFSALVPRPPLVLAATTMSVSRVYLGVHYPSDIAAGLALGTLVARAVQARRLPAR